MVYLFPVLHEHLPKLWKPIMYKIYNISYKVIVYVNQKIIIWTIIISLKRTAICFLWSEYTDGFTNRSYTHHKYDFTCNEENFRVHMWSMKCPTFIENRLLYILNVDHKTFFPIFLQNINHNEYVT